MKKFKRICSLCAVILIACMYIATLFCAIFVKELSVTLFVGSVVMTMFLPMVLYILMWLYRVFGNVDDREKQQDVQNKTAFAEADLTGKKTGKDTRKE